MSTAKDQPQEQPQDESKPGPVPGQPTPTPATAAGDRKCRCGFSIGNVQVHPEPKYSTLGWMLLFLGATPNPRYAVYRCGRCNQVLGATKDPAVLKEFTA
jgi:hypothetical protein